MLITSFRGQVLIKEIYSIHRGLRLFQSEDGKDGITFDNEVQ